MTNKTLRESGFNNDHTLRETNGQKVSSLDEDVSQYSILEGDSVDRHSRLPTALADDYRIVKQFPAYGNEADIYLVSDLQGKLSIAKIYRFGIEPKEDVLKLIMQADREHIVELKDYGYSDKHWWELMEYVEHSNLCSLIEREGTKLDTSRAKEVLRELTGALEHLHSLTIEHRDVKPANVLVRKTKPLDLVLADFGIASIVDASIHYTATARTLKYAPPEAMGTIIQEENGTARNVASIVQSKWDYWSLGMIIVEIISGHHPFDSCSEATISHLLSTQNVDELTAAVDNPAWRKLCRGLLRRDPKKRWEGKDIYRWLENPDDPSLKVHDEEPLSTLSTSGFRFQGISYYTHQALGEAFSKNWEGAESIWKQRNQELRIWLEHDLGETTLASALKVIDQNKDLNLDAQIFSAICILVGSGILPQFKNLILSKNSLEHLVMVALEGEATALELIEQLSESGVLSIASDASDCAELSEIEKRWKESIFEYKRISDYIKQHGAAVPSHDAITLTYLLACALSMKEIESEMRQNANRVITSDAKESEWFCQLGEIDSASPAALMIIPHAASTAEIGARRKKYTKNVKIYGLATRCLIGLNIGLVLGLVTAYLPGFIVYGFISLAWNEETAFTVALIWIGLCGVLGFLSCIAPWSNESGFGFVGNTEGNHNAVEMTGLKYIALGIGALGVISIIAIPEIIQTYEGFDQAEQRRISSHSADVWAGNEEKAKARIIFNRDDQITVYAKYKGKFTENDKSQLLIVYPKGLKESTCKRSPCRITPQDGILHSLGNYELMAISNGRVLAKTTFQVIGP